MNKFSIISVFFKVFLITNINYGTLEKNRKNINLQLSPDSPDSPDFSRILIIVGLQENTLKSPENPENPEKVEIHPISFSSYFTSLFPDTATRQCVLNAIKSSMTGVPLRNIFIWIGGGCNGKSLLLKVIRKILSDFCGVIPKNIIINSKSSSNITSELEPLSTLRFGQISELSDSDSLNETRVKEFTGDGVINYRGLFQKEKNVEVTASVHIATNNIPQIDCSDPALLTRIIPLPFTPFLI